MEEKKERPFRPRKKKWKTKIDHGKIIFFMCFNSLEGPHQHGVVVGASEAFILARTNPSQVVKMRGKGKDSSCFSYVMNDVCMLWSVEMSGIHENMEI